MKLSTNYFENNRNARVPVAQLDSERMDARENAGIHGRCLLPVEGVRQVVKLGTK